MFQDLMNMEGVAVLSKQQQSAVKGGQKCILTYEDASQDVIEFSNFEDSDPDASGAANSACVGEITSGDHSRCSYDCEHDGFGQ